MDRRRLWIVPSIVFPFVMLIARGWPPCVELPFSWQMYTVLGC